MRLLAQMLVIFVVMALARALFGIDPSFGEIATLAVAWLAADIVRDVL